MNDTDLPSLRHGSGSALTRTSSSISFKFMFSIIISAVSFARARLLTRITFIRHGPNCSFTPRISLPSLIPVNSACCRPSGVRMRFASSCHFAANKVDSVMHDIKTDLELACFGWTHLESFVVLSMTNQNDVPRHALFTDVSFSLCIRHIIL